MTSSLNFKSLNWKVIALFGMGLFYLCLIVLWSQAEGSPIQYGGDYLAFWSTGKIADEKGFSQIYNLSEIKASQLQAMESLGRNAQNLGLTPLPAPFFAIFIVPFKFLSRMPIQASYELWTILNTVLLIGYLAFFSRSVSRHQNSMNEWLFTLLLAFSFPVFDNLVNGQLNLFLLICVGEFIRNALKRNFLISGLWLGGLMLKPQVLILLIPILLIQRKWKVLLGFASSSAVIFLISLFLAGSDGMLAYARLLTGWGEANSVTAPQAMINWRMVATYFGNIWGSASGVIVAILGTILTLWILYVILHRRVEFGSSAWVLAMTGVMAATLLVTWHAHAHMAMVMVPFLLYLISHKLISERQMMVWVMLTPLAWFSLLLIGFLVQLVTKINILNSQEMVVAISGLASNLLILFFVYRNAMKQATGF